MSLVSIKIYDECIKKIYSKISFQTNLYWALTTANVFLFQETQKSDADDAETSDYWYFQRVMSAVQTSNIKPYKGAEDIDPRLVEEGYDRRDQHHDVSSAVPMTSETDDVTTSRDTDPEMKNDDVKTRDNGPEMKNDDVFNTGPEMKNDDILSLRDTEPEIKGRIKEKIRGLQHIKPRLPRKSYTLAPYVNE